MQIPHSSSDGLHLHFGSPWSDADAGGLRVSLAEAPGCEAQVCAGSHTPLALSGNSTLFHLSMCPICTGLGRVLLVVSNWKLNLNWLNTVNLLTCNSEVQGHWLLTRQDTAAQMTVKTCLLPSYLSTQPSQCWCHLSLDPEASKTACFLAHIQQEKEGMNL